MNEWINEWEKKNIWNKKKCERIRFSSWPLAAGRPRFRSIAVARWLLFGIEKKKNHKVFYYRIHYTCNYVVYLYFAEQEKWLDSLKLVEKKTIQSMPIVIR